MENTGIEPSEKLILIVDDDETVIDFLKFAVEKEGFKTQVATDGFQALEKVKSNSPDLIILDMMIPKKGGYEIIKALQSPDYSRIPILVITGRFIDDNFRQMVSFEPNVREYIIKPVKPPFLLHRIHTILGTVSSDRKVIEEKKKIIEERMKPGGGDF
ncbi:MAG: response regulator [Elusimicrobiota bacterium]